MNTVTIDQARFDRALQMANEMDAMLAQSSKVRSSTVIHIFPGDGLAHDAEMAAAVSESEYKLLGYAVTRHQTSRGTPYIKCMKARA